MEQIYAWGGVFNTINTNTLKSFDKKKLLIPTLIITSLILVITIFVSHAEFTSTDHVTIVDGVINYTPYDFKVMAMYIQQNSCIDTNNKNCYQEVEAMPSKGYTINETKSYCFINNENEKITGKVYTNSDGEHIIKDLEKRSKCIIYFDAIPGYYGTEENPIIINSINDLVELSNSVNSGNTYEGLYIKLEKDLDFQKDADYEDVSIKNAQISGSGFTPIGLSGNEVTSNPFKGIFDGNKKQIINLYINNSSYKNYYLGLFSYVLNGEVNNLTVTGSIKTTVIADIGGVVGRLENSKINNCTTNLDIESTMDSYALGGIVGWTHVKNEINNCTSYSNIKGGYADGGIVGYSNTGTLTINNSHNKGAITINIGQFAAGGILGYDRNDGTVTTIIKNSSNTGEIKNTLVDNKEISIGGIFGLLYGNATIENSFNTGKIENTRTSYERFIRANTGGIIGQIYNANATSNLVYINNCYNTGEILNGTYEGGIIGLNEGNARTIINKSYNTGTIDNSKITFSTTTSRSSAESGGIIGFNNGNTNIANAYILNSYNLGNISGIDTVGGILSLTHYNNNTLILNSYNLGNLTSRKEGINSSSAYGIGTFGKSSPSTFNKLKLYNVYNYGDVSSENTPYMMASINSVIDKTISKTYYKNDSGIKGSNITDNEIIGMSSTEMTNKTFTDTLNNNINSINLSEIFKDESNEVKEIITNIKLIDWIQGEEGYPVLNYKN